MTENIHTAEQSLAALKAQVALMEAEAEAASKEVARPLVEHLLETNTIADSNAKGSCWAGFKAPTFEITVDGKRYKVGVTVTDVARVAEREEEKAAAEKAAKVEKEMGPLLAKLEALQAQAGLTSVPAAS